MKWVTTSWTHSSNEHHGKCKFVYPLGRIADLGGVNTDPAVQKKPDPDTTFEKQP